jgi:hypothetical protein
VRTHPNLPRSEDLRIAATKSLSRALATALLSRGCCGGRGRFHSARPGRRVRERRRRRVAGCATAARIAAFAVGLRAARGTSGTRDRTIRRLPGRGAPPLLRFRGPSRHAPAPRPQRTPARARPVRVGAASALDSVRAPRRSADPGGVPAWPPRAGWRRHADRLADSSVAARVPDRLVAGPMGISRQKSGCCRQLDGLIKRRSAQLPSARSSGRNQQVHGISA